MANHEAIKEAWSEFYWNDMEGRNQSSTNVWASQRKWSQRVDEIIGT